MLMCLKTETEHQSENIEQLIQTISTFKIYLFQKDLYSKQYTVSFITNHQQKKSIAMQHQNGTDMKSVEVQSHKTGLYQPWCS